MKDPTDMKEPPQGTQCCCTGECGEHEGRCRRCHRRRSKAANGQLCEYAVYITKRGPLCKRCRRALARLRVVKAEQQVLSNTQLPLFNGSK
jgi:hypothetical protein